MSNRKITRKVYIFYHNAQIKPFSPAHSSLPYEHAYMFLYNIIGFFVKNFNTFFKIFFGFYKIFKIYSLFVYSISFIVLRTYCIISI